jgi:hypothetical protein
MKKVKELSVTVKYSVGLGDIEIPDDVYNEIIKSQDSFIEIAADSQHLYPQAFQWFIDNIKERDCIDITYEILNIDN